jgi:hypothetical protein
MLQSLSAAQSAGTQCLLDVVDMQTQRVPLPQSASTAHVLYTQLGSQICLMHLPSGALVQSASVSHGPDG